MSQKHRVDSTEPETPDIAAADASADAAADTRRREIQTNSPHGGRRYRMDAGERPEQTARTGNGRFRTDTPNRGRYIDEAQESAARGPHYEVILPRRSNLTSLMGQLLAYIGVLGLTVGTALVIYGHFGGIAEYTPTGWLVTTVAQMLLFLGIINLVSGGIEQNNVEVSTRINHLGEQLMRIEQVTEQALRGPKIDPRRYADPDSVAEEANRRTASLAENP